MTVQVTAPAMEYDELVAAVAQAMRDHRAAQADWGAAERRLMDADTKLTAARNALKDYDAQRVVDLLERG